MHEKQGKRKGRGYKIHSRRGGGGEQPAIEGGGGIVELVDKGTEEVPR